MRRNSEGAKKQFIKTGLSFQAHRTRISTQRVVGCSSPRAHKASLFNLYIHPVLLSIYCCSPVSAYFLLETVTAENVDMGAFLDKPNVEKTTTAQMSPDKSLLVGVSAMQGT